MKENDHINDKLPMSAHLAADERIAQYLQGRMSAEQERAFFEDMGHDCELRATATTMARLARAMDTVGVERDRRVREALLAVTDKEAAALALMAASDGCDNINLRKEEAKPPLAPAPKTNSGNVKKLLVATLSVAASAVVLVVAGTRYADYRATTELGNKYARAFSNAEFVRGSEDAEAAKECCHLFDNVRSGVNLDKTTARLALLWELSTQEIFNDYTNYGPEIGWNLALAYLKDNNKEKARAVLQQLEKRLDKGTVMQGDVEELLKEIK